MVEVLKRKILGKGTVGYPKRCLSDGPSDEEHKEKPFLRTSRNYSMARIWISLAAVRML